MNEKETTKPTIIDSDEINQEIYNKKYYEFFEYAPVALYIEDFSKVKTFIEEKAKENNVDVATYLNQSPRIVERLHSLVFIKDVNITAVKLFKANSKKDLLENLENVFTPESAKGFSKLVIDILTGKSETSVETVNKTFEGDEINIQIKYKVQEGSEEKLNNVIVSIEDITERVKINNALAISEKRYKESQEIAKLSSWYYDYTTKHLFCSEEVYKMLGISPNEEVILNLEHYLSFIHKDDHSIVNDFSFENLMSNPSQGLNYRIITKDGVLKHLFEKRSVIVKDGKINRVVGICQDITERVLSGQSLNVTKQLLSNTLSSIQDGFVILDKNSNYLYVNQMAANLLGKEVDELIGKHIWTEFPEKEGDVFFDNYQWSFKSRKPISFENYFTPWNRWFENRIIPSNDTMLLFFHEITERKESENKIKAAYNIINKSSSVAILCENKWDFPVVFASENAEKLFGYTSDELLSNQIKIYELIHPDDLNYIRTYFFNQLKSETEIETKPNAFRIITKNGAIKWIQTSTETIRNRENKITHIQGITEDITERKKAEDLFFESNQRLQDQFNNTPLASIIWDLDFKVIDWNNSAQRIFGYTLEEAKGRYAKDLIILPEHVDDINEVWNKLLNQKGGYRNTNKNKTKNGEVIISDWYNVTLKDADGNVIGVASLVDDITERVKKEEIENILYNISKAALSIEDFKEFGYFIKDELHKIIDTSNFYIALYNKEKDSFYTPVLIDDMEVGEEFSAEGTLTGYVVKTKKSLMFNHESHQKLREEGKVDLVGVNSKIWVGVPLISKDNVFGAIVVQSYTNEKAYSLKDVQLLEFVADQISSTILRKNTDFELKKALIKAQESDRLKSAFLANMSHEIRTPMNGIIGFSELFLDKDLSYNERKEYAKIVINSSKQLLSIVNDILDISKIEAGVVQLNYENVNVNELLNSLLIFYTPIAKEKNLTLTCVKQLKNFESAIRIDRTKLNQVLTNLLSNAFKFTDEGGIEFGYELIDKMLRFYVKDSGVGIDEKLHHKIFDRFVQADVDFEKQNKGTGLGLAISKKFVELFEGEIWLNSNDKGTTIYFTIPYKNVQPPVVTSVVHKKPEIKVKNNVITILVAEDEIYNLMYINELFSKTIYKIIEATNGKEAVQFALENPEIDLILMDIKMPVMNGKEAMKEIKKVRPHLPIIALSAFAMESDKEIALSTGFDSYLSKPLDKKLLFEMIEKYIQ